VPYPTNTTLLDAGNRTEDPLSNGAKWTGGGPSVAALECAAATGIFSNGAASFTSSWWNNATFTETEFYVDLTTAPADGNQWAALYARENGATGTNAYLVACDKVGAANDLLKIQDYKAGVWTDRATNSTREVVAGDALGIEVTGVGSTITVRLHLRQGGSWTQILTWGDTAGNRIVIAGNCAVEMEAVVGRVKNVSGGEAGPTTTYPSAIPDFQRTAFPFIIGDRHSIGVSRSGARTRIGEPPGPSPISGFERFLFPRLHATFEAAEVFETPTPGGALAGGIQPVARVDVAVGGVVAGGLTPAPGASVSAGGAIAAGTGPVTKVTVSTGGALVGGVAPSPAASVASGGVLAGGLGPTAAVTVSIGGVIVGGVAPAESGVAVEETPTPGGAIAGGLGPVAAVSVATGGALLGGTGPATRVTVSAGGALVGGTGPTARVIVSTGGVIVGGVAPAEPGAPPAVTPYRTLMGVGI
jgi:hypothetical protein